MLFSIYQIILAGNQGIAYCADQSLSIGVPVAWTSNLAMVQLLTVTGFTIWRLSVDFAYGDGEDEVTISQQERAMQNRIKRLDELDVDEDPWVHASDVSIEEAKKMQATRKYREKINKNYKERY